MQYRELGRTGWKVSALSFGAWAIGGTWGPVDESESLAALVRAVELGVTFFDTADVYGDGRSERLLAKLRKETREPIHIATKAGRRLNPHVTEGYNRKNLTAFAADDHRAFNREGAAFDRGETFSGVDYATGLQAVEELKKICPQGMSLTQFALRWILMFDAVTCAIPGAKRPSQAEENFSAADLPPLSEETMQAARSIYDRMIRPLVHHYW